MFRFLLLYLLPLLARFALTDTFEPARITLSLLPLVIVFPSTLLPLLIPNEEREHVWRHSIYALAFTVGSATSLRWDVVASSLQEGWAVYSLLFCVAGTLTLWWFVMSHVLENRFRFCFTHQGDVSVLPLTLVAIATFVYDVPDEAFQFSRCVLFYVPVIVAWATMHFVAFNGFAQSRTTTHSTRGFGFLSHSALIIAATHLTLIEVRASPIFFLVFPMVASLLSQVTPRPTSPPQLRRLYLVGMLTLQVGLSVGFGFLLRFRFDSVRVVLLIAIVGSVVASVVPSLCGNRWPVPSSLYATLLACAYIVADESIPSTVEIFDVLAIASQFLVTFVVTHSVAPPEESQPYPPGPAPSGNEAAPSHRVTSFLTALGSVPAPYWHVHGEATLKRLMRDRSDSCPAEFAGVWWTKGTSLPMQLVTVHGSVWRRDGDGVWTSTFSLRAGARTASVAGYLNRFAQSFCFTSPTWDAGDKWIRTPGWCFPLLRFLPATYWLYRRNEDEMARLVFDSTGKVVYRYRMLRVVRGDGTATRHHDDFLREHGGRPCIL